MNYGERLREVRKSKGMSQYRLSKLSGVPQTTLSQYENKGSEPGIDILKRLCSALEISVSDFLDETNHVIDEKEADGDSITGSVFSSRLKVCRQSKDMLQSHVAEKIGVARSTYAMYERGEREPNVDTIADLAKLFEVSADYLLGLVDDPGETVEFDTLAASSDFPLLPDGRVCEMELIPARGKDAKLFRAEFLRRAMEKRKQG